MSRLNELKEMDTAKLTAALKDARALQLKLRFQRTSGQAPRGHEFKQVRREIAQIKTLLGNQQQAGGAK